LSEKGNPTPLVHTLVRAPESRMDVLTPTEIDDIIGRSALARKYNQVVDRESAYEILNEKIAEFQQSQPAPKTASGKEEKSIVEEVLTSTAARQIGNTVARELTRGLLGVLGLGGSSRSRRKTGWF
jgi:hypothetical protein